MSKFIIFIFINSILLFSRTLQDVSFQTKTWELDNNAVIKNEVLNLSFDYRKSSKASITFLRSKAQSIFAENLFFLAGVKMPDVKPEDKVLKKTVLLEVTSSGKRIAYNDLPYINSKKFNYVFVNFNSKGKDEITISISVPSLGSKGVVIFKDPQITAELSPQYLEKMADWPYENVTSVCRLNIDTGSFWKGNKDIREKYGIMTKQNLHLDGKGNDGYKSPENYNFTKNILKPYSVRTGEKPDNWYNYRIDSFTWENWYEPKKEKKVITRRKDKHPNLKFLGKMTKELKITSFIVYNILYDSPEDNLDRYKKENGWYHNLIVEFGNENNCIPQKRTVGPSDQRCATIKEYIAKTKKAAALIKKINPNQKFAVNAPHVKHEWRDTLARETYYDYFVTHNYYNIGKIFGSLEEGNLRYFTYKELAAIFYAYNNLNHEITDCFKQLQKGKQLAFTEWGIWEVKDKKYKPCYWTMAGALGIAYMYMAITDNIEKIFAAHLYSAAMGIHGIFWLNKNNNKLYKRSKAMSYYIVHWAMGECSKIYKARSKIKPLNCGAISFEPVMVRAGEVVKNNKIYIRLFAVNSSKNDVPVKISLDGKKYTKQAYLRKAYTVPKNSYLNNDLIDYKDDGYKTENLTFDTDGTIIIPACSISAYEFEK